MPSGKTVNLEPPVIGILRGVQADFFGQLMDAAFEAGLQALEVTYNTPRAQKMITAQVPRVPQGRRLGMGTIRNLEEAKRAVDAGAMFLVTPNTDSAVIAFANRRNIPIVAGAFTPTEVYRAWSEGADMIKVFPCGHPGPDYIRALLGPFDQIPLVAVGGVTRENAGDYLKAGAKAVGVGSALFGSAAIASQKPRDIAANVKDFITRSVSDSESNKT
jgi:2-dehydro-3-deoxyphosphogluconate aldolase/(4S)-4-hydroxy-2-oxoglutarate aldolase